jgi:hypothetical protein
MGGEGIIDKGGGSKTKILIEGNGIWGSKNKM